MPRRFSVVSKGDKLVADPVKARFFMQHLEFVGHLAGGGLRRPAPGKLAAVQALQVPKP